MRVSVGSYSINADIDLKLSTTKKLGSPSRQRHSERFHNGKKIVSTLPWYKPTIIDYLKIGKAPSYKGDSRFNPVAIDPNFDGINRSGRPMQKASARLARIKRDDLNSSAPFLKSGRCRIVGKEVNISC